MSDIPHSTAPASPLNEDPPPRNPSNIIIWTISNDISEAVAPPVISSSPITAVALAKKPSAGSSQFSSGLFELQDAGGFHINQREEPGNVRARIAYSLLMLFAGLILIIVGIISELKAAMPGGGVPFWVIGSLLMIPGVYCTWDSVVTFRQLQLTDRMQICKEESARDGDVSA